MPPGRAALAVIGALMCASACAQTSAEPRAVAGPDVELASDSEMTPGRVRTGESFGTLLARQQVASDELEAMVASIDRIYDPRRMREGQAWRLQRTSDGRVRLFE